MKKKLSIVPLLSIAAIVVQAQELPPDAIINKVSKDGDTIYFTKDSIDAKGHEIPQKGIIIRPKVIKNFDNFKRPKTKVTDNFLTAYVPSKKKKV